MTILNSVKSLHFRGLRLLGRLQTLWGILLVVGVGVLLGWSINSIEQGELVASIVIVIAILALSFVKPLATVMVWIFFYPFLETVIKIPLGAGIPDLSFSRFTIAFLAVIMLAQAAIGKFRIEKIGPIEILIVFSTLGIALAAPMSLPNPTTVYQLAIAWYFTPFVAYYICRNLVKRRSDVIAILWAIALLGAVSALYAAYEHATGDILFLPRGMSTENLLVERKSLGIRIIRGIWGSAGAMGRVLALCIPVTFYLYLENGARQMRKLLLTGMLAVQGYGIIICMSRSPWISVLVALFIMQLFDKRFRKLFIVILIFSTIFVGLTWDRVMESNVVARINDQVSTYEGRQTRWTAGWGMWLARPLRGWGFGKFEKEAWRFRPTGSTEHLTAPENEYIHVMVSSGLLGILPYLGVLLLPLWNGLRLIVKARSLKRRERPWPGFVKTETIAMACAVIACYLIFSVSAVNVNAGLKLIVMAVAGSVIGSHEHLLRRPRNKDAVDAKLGSSSDASPILV